MYDSDGRIQVIADWTGRVWRYSYDDDGDLVCFAKPTADEQGSAVTTYEYATPTGIGSFPHNLVRVTDPKGQIYLENEYGQGPTRLDYNRVVRQRIGGGEIRIGYEAIVDDFDVTYSDVERPSIQVNFIERNGQVIHSIFNQFGNLLLREELVRTTSGLCLMLVGDFGTTPTEHQPPFLAQKGVFVSFIARAREGQKGFPARRREPCGFIGCKVGS